MLIIACIYQVYEGYKKLTFSLETKSLQANRKQQLKNRPYSITKTQNITIIISGKEADTFYKSRRIHCFTNSLGYFYRLYVSILIPKQFYYKIQTHKVCLIINNKIKIVYYYDNIRPVLEKLFQLRKHNINQQSYES